MGITEHGKFVLNIMKDNGLLDYYDTLSGNCCFSKEEYDDNISSIKKVTEILSEYGVLRQSIEDYGYYGHSSDGCLYFLTDYGFEDADESEIVIHPKEIIG